MEGVEKNSFGDRGKRHNIWGTDLMLIVGFDTRKDCFTLKINGVPHENLKKDGEEEKEMCRYKSMPLNSKNFMYVSDP